MDLAAEAERLRLDLLAVEVSAALTGADVPHALLKGPSTANWLYAPPRPYRDVDVLVATSRMARAADALAAAGIAHPKAGLAGEEAQHSLLLASAAGFEIDLHRSLPAVPVRGDTVWDVLVRHVETLDLGVGLVPAFDEPARCVVLALHAVSNPASDGQAVEDLRRACAAASAGSWATAAVLAETMAVRDLFDAALGLVATDRAGVGGSRRGRLYTSGAPGGALALQRLADARLRELPRLIAREVVPSRGFMRGYANAPLAGFSDLLRAHIGRWRSLLAELPAAARAWRAARRAPEDAN